MFIPLWLLAKVPRAVDINAAGIKDTADNVLVANRLAAEANAVLIRPRWFDPVGTTGFGLPYQLPPSFVSAKAMQ
jgi:hypothetical protein